MAANRRGLPGCKLLHLSGPELRFGRVLGRSSPGAWAGHQRVCDNTSSTSALTSSADHSAFTLRPPCRGVSPSRR